jgi:hypothetical protein
MGRCVNEKCDRDPSSTGTYTIVSCDGDAACCPECAAEFRKQMNHFCSVTLKDDKKFAAWMGVPKSWVSSKK